MIVIFTLPSFHGNDTFPKKNREGAIKVYSKYKKAFSKCSILVCLEFLMMAIISNLTSTSN